MNALLQAEHRNWALRCIYDWDLDRFDLSADGYLHIIRKYLKCKVHSMVQEFGQETYSLKVKRIVDYMDYHIASDLTLHQIAEEFNYSPAYVNRLLKSETGYSAM